MRFAKHHWLLAPLALALPAAAARAESAAPPAPGHAREVAEARAGEEEALWGRFRKARGDRPLDPEQRELLALLNEIGYASGSQSAQGSGVSRHDAARAHRGLNFYTSGHAPEAVLIDMDGRELHRWRLEAQAAWPDVPAVLTQENSRWWRRARLLPNGDVLAIFAGIGIVRVDRDSKLLWARLNGAHHDLELQPDGSIVTLVREWRRIDFVNPDHPVLDDLVVVLDAEGREQRRVSLLEAFERSRYRGFWRDRAGRQGDILHANTVSVLDGRLAARHAAFRRGNILISCRSTDVIAVLDPAKGVIVWAQSGGFRGQHDPKLLDNGQLLLFDNLGPGQASRVIEMDPLSGKASWVFQGSAEEPFFTRTCGSADRLPNGNTLMVESDNGRAIEVSPDKRVVWEFWNPNRAGAQGEFIATLFDVDRVPPEYARGWLGAAAAPRAPGASGAR